MTTIDFDKASFVDVESPPVPPPDPSEIVSCKVCGDDTVKPEGRKRGPYYCDAHRPASASRSSHHKSSSKQPPPKLRDLQESLADNVRLFGALIGPVLPTTGYLVLDESDNFTKAVIELAKDKPKVLAALAAASQVGPAVGIARFVLSAAIAIMVDTGRLPPEALLVNVLPVGRAYAATHPSVDAAGGTNQTPPPPRFSKVGES